MAGPDAEGDESGAGRVAYQGAPGAFSHAACAALRPWDVAVAFETFDAAIAAVKSGDCASALIPVENSTIGAVEPASSLVAASGLEISADVWRPIRLALMGAPDASLSSVKLARSHPAALGQCIRSLADMGIQAEEAFDTAGAARDLADSGDRTWAAVAPAAAAEIYGLRILRNDIQDSDDNRTRFVVLTRPRG